MKHELENVDKVLLEKELVIKHKKDQMHFMDRAHFHDGFEIHFTLTNTTTYQVDDRTFIADSGSIALFSPEEIHRVSIDRNKLYERYFILFKANFLEDFLNIDSSLLNLYNNKNNCFKLSFNNQQKITEMFESIIDSYNQENKNLSLLMSKIKLAEILILLTNLGEADNNLDIPFENNDALSNIVSFIKTNYMYDLSLELLCEKFFISKSTIIRLFKKTLGMTPNQYLIYVRIMKSLIFLEKGYSIRDTSKKVGYNDESNFIKKFKELQGISPKQYSLKLQNKRR